MKRPDVGLRISSAFFALLLTACPGGPQINEPPEIDLSRPRHLESEGRNLDALEEYARIIEDLTESGRADARAHVAWGRIFGSLRRLKVWEAPDDFRSRNPGLEGWTPALLNSVEAGHWTQVLAGGSEPPILAEAAGAIADLLEEKAEDRSLRRGRLEPEDDVSERLYRRALIHAASDYARYAALRAAPRPREATARAVKLLRRLAEEIRAIASLTGVLPEAAARWEENASHANAAAVAFRQDRDGSIQMSNELRIAIEVDPPGLLKSATEEVNQANDLLSRRATEGEILDLLERALRNFVTARESLVEPSAIQKRTLDVMPIAADALRGLGFAR